jgi:phosphonopyruvate decarboxylase
LSLCDKEVYSIPIILLIGWRGQPDIQDEPQHIKQGRVTPSILESMEIPFKLINKDENQSIKNVNWAIETAKRLNSPVALLVQKDAFDKSEINKIVNKKINNYISRENAISIITENISNKTILVSTTGMISRELYEKRSKSQQDRSKDFLTVGSMGHASQIALGIAKANPNKKVVCLDGDGAVLMHLGGMATIGTNDSGNLLHIVLNNGAHDSVGGQPTVAQKISLTSIAKACCYNYVEGPIKDKNEIINVIKRFNNLSGMCFLEIYVDKGHRKDLGRPKESPIHNKEIFLRNIRY